MPPPNHNVRLMIIWAPTLIILAPLNFWAASCFSLELLLHGYLVLFSSMMSCLAVTILFAGIMLPPASLAYWVWEKYQEPVAAAAAPP